MRKFIIFVFITFLFQMSIFMIAIVLIGFDPASGITNYLPFIPNGALLAGVVGALLSGWLLSGGNHRIAGFGGWQLGVFAGYLVWLIGRSYVWLIEVVLKAAFGDNAVFFSSIIVMGILFGVMRLVSQYGVQFLVWVMEKGEEWEQSRLIQAELANVNIEAESGA